MYNIEYLLLHGALLIKSRKTSPMDLITAESESDADCCSPGLLVFAKALSYTSKSRGMADWRQCSINFAIYDCCLVVDDHSLV